MLKFFKIFVAEMTRRFLNYETIGQMPKYDHNGRFYEI